jgi:hypothetical protein
VAGEESRVHPDGFLSLGLFEGFGLRLENKSAAHLRERIIDALTPPPVTSFAM